ncbi:MAG: hypothetical protein ACFHWZ_05570 [Phycisphaerales bacterium]
MSHRLVGMIALAATLVVLASQTQVASSQPLGEGEAASLEHEPIRVLFVRGADRSGGFLEGATTGAAPSSSPISRTSPPGAATTAGSSSPSRFARVASSSSRSSSRSKPVLHPRARQRERRSRSRRWISIGTPSS